MSVGRTLSWVCDGVPALDATVQRRGRALRRARQPEVPASIRSDGIPPVGARGAAAPCLPQWSAYTLREEVGGGETSESLLSSADVHASVCPVFYSKTNVRE